PAQARREAGHVRVEPARPDRPEVESRGRELRLRPRAEERQARRRRARRPRRLVHAHRAAEARPVGGADEGGQPGVGREGRRRQGRARSGRCRLRLRHRRRARRGRRDRDPAPRLGAASRPLRDRGGLVLAAKGGGAGVDRPRAGEAGPGSACAGRLRPAVRRLFPLGVALAAGVMLLFLLLPIVAIFARVPPGDLVSALGRGQATDALVVSIETNLIALAAIVLVGTPTAWLIATRPGRLRDVAVTLVELPLVLPPAVAGIGLLAAFGRVGLVGGHVHAIGSSLAFTKAAVVVAIAFVASPFYVRSAIAAFESIDPAMTQASRTLGAGAGKTFVRIALPLAAGGLGSGAALAFARGIGEFGATL